MMVIQMFLVVVVAVVVVVTVTVTTRITATTTIIYSQARFTAAAKKISGEKARWKDELM